MLNKELVAKFFKDFQVPFQEEDASFIFANPSDAAKGLIKGRNWIGTLTEKLVELGGYRDSLNEEIRKAEEEIAVIELKILAESFPISTVYTKNKEVQKAWILAKSKPEESFKVKELQKIISVAKSNLNSIESDRNQIKLMLEMLVKSTDWLSQYINWVKFEARNLDD